MNTLSFAKLTISAFFSALCSTGTGIICVSRSNETAAVTPVKMTVVYFWYAWLFLTSSLGWNLAPSNNSFSTPVVLRC